MMGVGEFAQATGLTVKALHLYDERGILAPAEVDGQSGYRRYSAAQLRTALLLKALRDVGVPLSQLAGGDVRERFTELLTQHLIGIEAERRRQEAAAARAQAVFAGFAAALPVGRRRVPAQHYAAAVLRFAAEEEDPDAMDESVGEALTVLWERLETEENAPTGPFWLAFGGGRSGRGRRATDRSLSCCWPVARRPDGEGWEGGTELAATGAELIAGTLPDREELFLRWPAPDAADSGADVGPHPALAALLEAVEAQEDVDPARLRQITLMGGNGGPGGVELSYALYPQPA